MHIAVGSDHRGQVIRSKVIESIDRAGHKVEELGTDNNGPVWLNTPFEGGRHARRVEKIAALEREK